jgi:6-phosphogluconolactonase (cycloisomerase 2 family)
MKNKFNRLSLALAIVSLIPAVSLAEPFIAKEKIYTLSNGIQNEIYVYEHSGNGVIQAAGNYATGGAGTAASLANQGALALSENQRYLFAINAGSNELSVFSVDGDVPVLLDHVAEQGVTPVSVTVSGNLVYVVNSGDDSIFGYRFDPLSGKLHALKDSYYKLNSTGSGAAEISFNKGGDALVVTAKATNKIISITLNEHGLPANRHLTNSNGVTPYGFAFGKHDQFFVTEAQGGAANATTVSSYKLSEDGAVTLIDGSVADGQTAACWLATTPNGRLAFASDAHSNAISAYAVSRKGELSLLESLAAAENVPLDLAVSKDGTVLYSLNAGDQSISTFSIDETTGALQNLQNVYSVPATATGLVVK